MIHAEKLLHRLRSLGKGALVGSEWQTYVIMVAILGIWIVFNMLTDGLFLSSRNLVLLLRQCAITAIAGAGMCLLIVSGNFDLSVGSSVGLSSTFLALLLGGRSFMVISESEGFVAESTGLMVGLPPFVLVALVVLVSIAMGMIQGWIISYVGVNSFITTMAGMMIYRGLVLVIGGGITIAPISPFIVKFGEGFVSRELSLVVLALVYAIGLAFLLRGRSVRGRSDSQPKGSSHTMRSVLLLSLVLGVLAYLAASYRGIPNAVVIMIAVFGVLIFVSRRTTLGRAWYAIGGNREAARLAGINVAFCTFLAFAMMGVLYAVGGTLLTARLNGASPSGGMFLELDAIAAAVVGGTRLSGGVGRVEGAFVGALLMESITNGMNLMNFNPFLQQVVRGLVLLVAVVMDVLASRGGKR